MFGGQFHVIPKQKVCDIYNFGLVYEHEKETCIGIKHQSVPKARYGIGNVSAFVQHKIDDDVTAAGDASFNFETKDWNLKAAITGRYFEDLVLKARIDKNLNVRGVIFYQSDKDDQKTSLSTGFNLRDITSVNTFKNLQFGIGVDMKL